MALYERVDPRFFAGTVADEILYSLEDALSERERVSLVLSGGSTPSAIFRTLAKPPRSSAIDWQRVDFFFGDERFVPADDHQSNFRLARETLLSPLKIAESSIYGIDTNTPSAADAALKYDKQIRDYFSLHPAQTSERGFDVLMLGIGTDGHVASLFPGDAALDEQQQYAVACRHPKDGTERISLTLPAIEAATRILFVVSGESKSSIVQRTLEGDDSTRELPARFFTRVEPKVTFYLDSEAASQLPVPAKVKA